MIWDDLGIENFFQFGFFYHNSIMDWCSLAESLVFTELVLVLRFFEKHILHTHLFQRFYFVENEAHENISKEEHTRRGFVSAREAKAKEVG